MGGRCMALYLKLKVVCLSVSLGSDFPSPSAKELELLPYGCVMRTADFLYLVIFYLDHKHFFPYGMGIKK